MRFRFFLLNFPLRQFPVWSAKFFRKYTAKFLIRHQNLTVFKNKKIVFFYQKSICQVFPPIIFTSPLRPKADACGSKLRETWKSGRKRFVIIDFCCLQKLLIFVKSGLICFWLSDLILSLLSFRPCPALKLTESQKYFLFSNQSGFRFSRVQLK